MQISDDRKQQYLIEVKRALQLQRTNFKKFKDYFSTYCSLAEIKEQLENKRDAVDHGFVLLTTKFGLRNDGVYKDLHEIWDRVYVEPQDWKKFLSSLRFSPFGGGPAMHMIIYAHIVEIWDKYLDEVQRLSERYAG